MLMKSVFKAVCLSLLLVFSISSLSRAQQPKTNVTLGIKLDYFFSGKDGGVKAKGVVAHKTAEKAGIKGNDIILALNDTRIKGLFHYRDLLATFKPGDKVRIKVKRGAEILYFNTQFQ